MTRLLSPVFAAFLLSACAAQPELPEIASEPAPTPPVTESPELALPERAIPADSLYPLLLAEFALRRRAYDVALEQYTEQAPLLRDAGISAHTTHLTQFMQEEERALEAVQLWVELEPENTEARNTLATLLVRDGRSWEALPHLAELQRLGGRANFPILAHGFKDLTSEQQAQMAARLDALGTEFPDDAQLLLAQALVHTELGNTGIALQRLDQVLEIEPERSEAMLLEARLLLEQGKRKPFARIDRALAAEPTNTRLRLQYARILTRHDMAAAREQFEVLSAQSPNDADLLFSLALINQDMGDRLTARAYLTQLLELGERENDANFYLGRIAEEEGDLKLALKHYMKVTEGREFLAANSRVGDILMSSGQFSQSRVYFRALRARYPGMAERLYALEADLLGQAGQLQASVDLLTLALADLPDSYSLRYARSMALEQQDELELMEQDLRAIIDNDPENATALNALGYTLADRTDRIDEAQDLIARALALEPEEPAILDSMGWVLYRQGQLEESLVYLRRAYQRFPDPEVAAHLGEVLWVKGDREEALEIWREALEDDPEHEVLLSTLERFGLSDMAPATAAQ